jgi:3-oxoacyl-[acyl-carrier-protein] synthase-1
VIAGTGNACDAFHHTASSVDGEGASLAMTTSPGFGRLEPEDIDYVNAHGTATPNNDASEMLPYGVCLVITCHRYHRRKV